MRTRVSVALNRIELHSLDPSIIIHGVQEQAPNWNITTGTKAGGMGQFVNGIEKRYREVTVKFAINERRDLQKRMQVLQEVAGWAANGGDLEVSYREQQRLRVVCAQLPAIENITGWTDDFTIVFRAYRVPFWESEVKEQVSVTASTNSYGTLMIRETGGGKLCAIGTNNSGSGATSVFIANSASYNGITMESSDPVLIPNGSSIVFDYDENDLQRIRKLTGTAYSSILKYRSADSDDAIILKQGENSIHVVSDVAMNWTLYTYGRWE